MDYLYIVFVTQVLVSCLATVETNSRRDGKLHIRMERDITDRNEKATHIALAKGELWLQEQWGEIRKNNGPV